MGAKRAVMHVQMPLKFGWFLSRCHSSPLQGVHRPHWTFHRKFRESLLFTLYISGSCITKNAMTTYESFSGKGVNDDEKFVVQFFQ
jgi:hypothetical protein